MALTEAEFEENHRALYDALLAACNAQGRFRVLGQEQEAQLLNVALFAILFNFDLSCLLRDLSTPRAAWHIRLHSRHIVVTMYECVEDFLWLLGKDFRTLISERSKNSEILKQLNDLHGRLRRFQSEHPEFKVIRNTVSAHREHDAMVQVKTLHEIDPFKVRDAGYEMLQWLSELHGLVTAVLREAKHPGASSSGAA